MQLDEFVTETLNALIKGINSAQTFAKDNGAIINPLLQIGGPISHIKIPNSNNYATISNVEFDVAVTASSKQESGLNGGINVFSINLGGKTSDEDANETVSRIKFKINAVLPSGNVV